jgi:limonene-1,2-epoxide hydrolase
VYTELSLWQRRPQGSCWVGDNRPEQDLIFRWETNSLEKAESIALIRRFIDSCVLADPEEFASYFCEDAIWWNSPWQPVKGRDAIRDTLRRGAERMTALPWEVRHIMADGDVVMTERVDHFLVGNHRVSVPCMGVFELRGGKISAWRDYWDAKQFESQMPPSGRAGE